MAIIYTYPRISSLQADDCMLVSDDSDGKKTKSVSLSTIKSFVGGGSAAMLTVQTSNGGTVVNNVTDIKVTGQLTDDGNGVVTITTDAGSGGTPSAPLNSVQFNDNDAFSGSANLTFNGTNKLDVTHMVDIKGDGTNAGKLKLYCKDTTTPHYVELQGPEHGVSGQANYTITLPAVAPSTGQVLKYTGAQGSPFTWETPLAETSGTWTPILGSKQGANGSLSYTNQITQNTAVGSWRRIGNQMYYDFYIEFTILAALGNSNLMIGAMEAGQTNGTDLWGLPIDDTTPGSGTPTLKANTNNNGSCQITQATGPTTAMWEKMPQTGKVGRTEAGIVDLASHNYMNDPGSTLSPLQTIFKQDWWNVDQGDCVLAGTIIAEAAAS